MQCLILLNLPIYDQTYFFQVQTMKKPHVAFLPSPGMGHVTPLLQLATRLVTLHGFQVTFLVITTHASTAQTQLLRSPSLPPDLHVIDIPPADVSHLLTHETPLVTQLSLIVQESLRPLRSILLDLNQRPKALVIDIFTTNAFEVCRDLYIPVYSFFTASAGFLAFSLYMPTLDRQVEGEFVDLPEPIQVPGCKPTRFEDLINQVRNRKADEHRWFLLHISRLPMAEGIFMNTWTDLEPVALQAIEKELFFQSIPTPPVHAIGPLIKENESPLTDSDAQILRWLDKQPGDSVVYVALGSEGTLTHAQLMELAWGLEISQQRFILVVRKPSEASACAAIFNVGSDTDDLVAYLPKGFMERTKGVGMVVQSWGPQVTILGHPSTGVFLSHCGWNSTLESVANGVPMIAWPLYAEQRMTATMLAEEVGVAMKVGTGGGEKVVGREEIERVVRVMMEGEQGAEMRRKARELKASAGEALSYGGSSYQSLARVAESWKSYTDPAE